MLVLKLSLTIGLILPPLNEAAQLTLTLYNSSSNNKVFCNDGTYGGYYFRPAPEDANDNEKNNWIFYQEGGGWCFDQESCSQRFANNDWLISSKNWPLQREFHGIFEMLGTPLAKANLVFIPYCSRSLALEAFSTFVAKKKNQTVIFGGTSAGGRGSMVTIDFFREMLDNSNRLFGLHDSSGYEDIPKFPNNVDLVPFGEQCKRAYTLYGPPISLKCAQTYPDELWKCLCGGYMLPDVLTPSQVILHQYDSFQIGENFEGVEPKDWTTEMCNYVERSFRPEIRDTVSALANSDRHVVFGPACYMHGLPLTGEFFTITVDNLTASQQLVNFVFGDQRTSVESDCEGVNCQVSCIPIELGPSSLC